MSEQLNFLRAMVDTRGDSDDEESIVEKLLRDPSLPVPFIASTEGVKEDGFDLRGDDWDLRRYGTYGPVMWIHNYWHPTLGRGDAHVDDGTLKINVHFDEDDEFAMMIRGKAIKGMMAGSVGWREYDLGEGEKRNELREFSMVPMGLDPDALPEIERQGLRYMRLGIAEALKDEELAGGSALVDLMAAWREETAKELEALMEKYLGQNAEDEEEREEETPEEETPEGTGEEVFDVEPVRGIYLMSDGSFMSMVFGDDEKEDPEFERWLSGLIFNHLEEAGDERVGVAISQKNRSEIQRAIDLLQNVLDRTEPNPAEDDEAPEGAQDPEEDEDNRSADDNPNGEESEGEDETDEETVVLRTMEDLLPVS